jgi:transcription termination factor Rho
MLLPELQSLASSLGITSAKMRKADLIGAISAAQSGGRSAAADRSASPAVGSGSTAPSASAEPASSAPPREARTRRAGADRPVEHDSSGRDGSERNGAERNGAERNGAERNGAERNGADDGARTTTSRNGSLRSGATHDGTAVETAPRDDADRSAGDRAQAERSEPTSEQRNQNGQRSNEPRSNEQRGNEPRSGQQRDSGRQGNQRNDGNQQRTSNPRNDNPRNENPRNETVRNDNPRNETVRNDNPRNETVRNDNPRNDAVRNESQQNDRNDFDDDSDGGRRRGRRYRDRRGRTRTTGGTTSNGAVASNVNDLEPTVTDDDVLVPVAGILDAIEDKNAWFVRTNGYFASSDDIYVANSFVRRYNLRRGDAVTGAIRQNTAAADKREKFSPLVRLDTVNGLDPEQLKNRVEFTKLTPLYPQDRLRLETEQHILTTRVIDLVMPIGKGQRALIASPPKAGKTMVLQAIANAIATNNPECHLMVVLIDERPEEVTDMQRSVKGEVIASTFDRRPNDHTMVAELSIERAKRLVEMGHDVVVLLDSITRLGRAYNLAAPASGRILSGGVDSTALYPPKRFLGAARNIENGGSLTILATALVETGSAGDQVIYEEFKGTGNAELKLDRKIADKRTFPAIDVDQSSTRKEEILLSPDELVVTIKLRRVLHALETQQAIDLLLDRLKKTRNNIEFLMQIAKTTPGQD